MAITYQISANPHWVIIDDFSKLPPGAAIYTYSHLNPSVYKPAYQDPAGQIIYTQPIDGFGNGTFAPIYWATDSNDPDDTYYIEVWSARKENNGVLLWVFDGLTGSGSGGGGGGTTILNDVENFVVNGQFYDNTGNRAGSTLITLAPSNHAAIGGYANNPVTDAPPSPDIIFAKGNNSATDAISFIDFSPLGNSDLSPNPTPQLFVRYSCTGAGTSENYKVIQFPLMSGVQNLSNQPTSLRIWAKSASSSTGIQLYYRQFFGNGTTLVPSPDVRTPIGGSTLALTANWQPFDFVATIVPSVATKQIGDCGNDALYLQINIPLDVTLSVDFILPACYLGANTSTLIFDTFDQVEALVTTPRTGDIRTTLNNFVPGWVQMNDGTIGNASSNATARANIDTFLLFDLIWTTFQASQTLAPMYASGAYGVPVAYGASSVADFSANRQLSLTKNLGRVMAGALPVQVTQAFTTPVANTLTVASTASFNTGAPVTVSSSTVPALVNGTTYYAIVLTATTMSLATTYANAIAGTAITFGIGAGTGNVIIAAHALGSVLGEERHLLAPTELPSPFTTSVPSTTLTNLPAGGGTTLIGITGGGSTNLIQTIAGGNQPHNIMQPTVYMNVYIKL